jgi:ribonuclease R
VTTFGVFVTLDAMYVEGLVHITELGGDYFRFDEARQELRGERSGVRYGIGARVRVQVSRVDLDGRRIDFRLVRDGEDGLVQSSRSGRGQAKDEGRGRRDSRDERSAGGYSDKWSRRDAKASRAQRNAAAEPAAAPEPDRSRQGRKAAKKAMLKSVNLAALEAEYAQAPKPEPVAEPVAVAVVAKPRKAAGRKQVAALLAPDAQPVSVAKPAAKPESKAVAKVAAKSVAKSAPKAPKAVAKPAARTKPAPASKTSKRKTER